MIMMVFFCCVCNCDGCIVTRLGLVLVVDGNMSVTGRDDAGVAFARAFDFIKADQSPAKALSFITDVSVLFACMCVCVGYFQANLGPQFGFPSTAYALAANYFCCMIINKKNHYETERGPEHLCRINKQGS